MNTTTLYFTRISSLTAYHRWGVRCPTDIAPVPERSLDIHGTVGGWWLFESGGSDCLSPSNAISCAACPKGTALVDFAP